MAASNDAHDTKREDYEQARSRFDRMNLEDQATFWVETTASLLARGVQEAGRSIAREMDHFFSGFQRRKERTQSGGPGPAEPETAQQRAPRDAASDE